MIGKKYLIKQHPKPNRALNVSEAVSCEMVCFKSTVTYHGQAGNGGVGVDANAFPFFTRKARGTAACTARWLCKGAVTIHFSNRMRPTTAVSSYGPRSECSILSAAEVCWHPPHLSGLSEEDVEKEEEALTPKSSNLQLQEDSFAANTFHGFLLPVIYRKLRIFKTAVASLRDACFQILSQPNSEQGHQRQGNLVPC